MSPAREFKRVPGERPLLAIAGGLYDILAGGDETGGLHALVETTLPPDNGPPPHAHAREDEVFYVLSGEITFTVGGREHVASAGTTRRRECQNRKVKCGAFAGTEQPGQRNREREVNQRAAPQAAGRVMAGLGQRGEAEAADARQSQMDSYSLR